MSDAKRTKNYIVFKLRKSYREGKLDTSQVARLKASSAPSVRPDGDVILAERSHSQVEVKLLAGVGAEGK